MWLSFTEPGTEYLSSLCYNASMNIAMIGQKGMVLGERGGGIERHVAEVSTHLVEAGHDVTVYARAKYAPEKPRTLRGVRLVFLPTIYKKNLEAIVHTLFASLHALFQGYDIIHYHGVGPATLAWIPRLFARRAKTIVTFHSQDQFHKKWNWFARRYLAFGERAAATFPHYCISVSHVIQVYCRDHFHREVVYIPNGATPKRVDASNELEKFGLERQGYILNVGRIVPQKGLQFLIEAYKQIETDKQLVIVGGGGFSKDYEQSVRQLGKGRSDILFLGYQSGDALEQLFAHAYIYCQPSESEGLPVVVLESMSYGVAPLVSNIPENLEAAHHAGFSFKNTDVEDLKKQLQYVLTHPEQVEEKGEEAQAVIETKFDWKLITQQIEGVYITARH